MALFDRSTSRNETVESAVATNSSPLDVQDFSMFGAGVSESQVKEDLKTLGNSGTAYLSITQQLSEAVSSGAVQVGMFMNSATKEVYGKTVDVVPLAFKPVWVEADEGTTVATYEPGGIEVTRSVPTGKRKEVMTNPRTGFRVSATYIMAFVECSSGQVLMYTPRTTSVVAMERFIRASATVPHPKDVGSFCQIYQNKWRLKIGSFVDDKGRTSYCVGDHERLGFVDKALYTETITPLISRREQLLITDNEE